MKEFLKNIGRHLLDKSGLRLIWEKFNPPKEKDVKRKPSTILLWAFGLYFALYGITATRYGNKIDRIDNHANIVIAQLGSKNYKNALAMIPSVQKRTAPYEPYVLNPLSVIYSWDESKDTLYNEVVERLKDVVVAWKSDLDSVHLSNAYLVDAYLVNANLENAYLMNANLENAYLWDANLENAYLMEANLKNSELYGANLKNAYIEAANLEKANLSKANLENAKLWDVKLENAYLKETNMMGIKTSNSSYNETYETRTAFIKELEKAIFVKDIQLDEEIMEIIRKDFLKLLKRIENKQDNDDNE